VSQGRYVLLYFDIDLHNAWQTTAEGQEAKRLLTELLACYFGKSVIYWCDSSRGFNGYLKVDRQYIKADVTNNVFAALQHSLQLFLAYYGNLADFEIKGRIGYMADGKYNWAQYSKLPVHSPSWNFAKLNELEEMQTVPLLRLQALCRDLDKRIPLDVLTCHKERKKHLGDQPIIRDNCFLVTPAIEKLLLEKHGEGWPYIFGAGFTDRDGCEWLGMKYYRAGDVPITELELRQAAQTTIIATAPPPELVRDATSTIAEVVEQSGRHGSLVIKTTDLKSEPDSFVRQKEALFRLARRLKRVPTMNEAMQVIQDEQLFTGTWQEHTARRSARFQSILTFIARTFDASKIAKGSVNVGKYDEWARKKFPEGLVHQKMTISEEGHIVEGAKVEVSPGFIAIFMSVVEFGLLTDKNTDGSLPHHRGEELWKSLYEKGVVTIQFCDRKWAACRIRLDQLGIINVDPTYSQGKAMKWDVGSYFPGLGLWKRVKVKTLGQERRDEKKEERRTQYFTVRTVGGFGVIPVGCPDQAAPVT